MQQVSGGVEVPSHTTDVVLIPTTDAIGQIVHTLKYTPKIESIQAQFEYFAGRLNRFIRIGSFAGKTATFVVYKFQYEESAVVTGSDVGSSGAPANHTHSIALATTDVGAVLCGNEVQPNVYISYGVL